MRPSVVVALQKGPLQLVISAATCRSDRRRRRGVEGW